MERKINFFYGFLGAFLGFIFSGLLFGALKTKDNADVVSGFLNLSRIDYIAIVIITALAFFVGFFLWDRILGMVSRSNAWGYPDLEGKSKNKEEDHERYE